MRRRRRSGKTGRRRRRNRKIFEAKLCMFAFVCVCVCVCIVVRRVSVDGERGRLQRRWWRGGTRIERNPGYGGERRSGGQGRRRFPLDVQKGNAGAQGSTARNVSGARTHKKNGRQNPRASYFTVCQAVRGFYNITDKRLGEEELRPSKRLRRRRRYLALMYTTTIATSSHRRRRRHRCRETDSSKGGGKCVCVYIIQLGVTV